MMIAAFRFLFEIIGLLRLSAELSFIPREYYDLETMSSYLFRAVL